MIEEKESKTIEETKPKKKKKKVGILYENKFYVLVDRAKYIVKNVLNFGSYSTLCQEYLVDKYRSISEKSVNTLLLDNNFIMMPTWSNCIDDIMEEENKDLFNTILQKVSDYRDCKVLKDLRYPKYASIFNFMEDQMKDVIDLTRNSEHLMITESKILYSIQYIKRAIEGISKESVDVNFLKNASMYIGTCADFVSFDPQDGYPAIAITLDPVDMRFVDDEKFSRYGILFKMKGVMQGKTIFIEEYDYNSGSCLNWEEFIKSIDNGKVGKVVGEGIFIPPYKKIGFVLNPLTLVKAIRWIHIR